MAQLISKNIDLVHQTHMPQIKDQVSIHSIKYLLYKFIRLRLLFKYLISLSNS